MNKFLCGCLCLAGVFLLSGCGGISYQAGNSNISKMKSADFFTIGKTTLNEVHNELGGTSLMFDKGDGAMKYVWQSENTGGDISVSPMAYVPIVGAFTGMSMETRTNRNTLALTFDKNNILIDKSFRTGDYQDPDVSKMGAQMMNKMYKQ